MLFLLRPDSILPLVVQGPSTSIPAIWKYVVGLSNEETPFHHIYTQLTLEKVPAGSLSYSRIVARSLGPLSPRNTSRRSRPTRPPSPNC